MFTMSDIAGALHQPAGAGAPTKGYNDEGNSVMIPSKEKVLGMNPQNFAAVVGQMGSAFAPKDSWQQKIGQLASSLGTQQLQAEVEKQRHNAALANTKKMLSAIAEQSPKHLGTIASMFKLGQDTPQLSPADPTLQADFQKFNS